MNVKSNQDKPAIVMENVCKKFGKTEVLKNITVQAQKGQIIGLMGRNGEGKTTLMRTLLDIEPIDSGRIEILGQEPDGTGILKKHIGYVPEKPRFHTYFNATEILEYRAQLFPHWDWEKVKTVAESLEFPLDTNIKGASKGTLAKLAWICATAFNPEVLLLDEPTEGLDALVRSSVTSELIGELAESGKTILVANHRMEEISGVLDEIWVLKNGSIPTTYPMEELLKNGISITGRLRQDAPPLPTDLPIHEIPLPGDMVCWHTIHSTALDTIREKELLTNMQVEKLPLNTTLKMLLRNGEGAG